MARRSVNEKDLALKRKLEEQELTGSRHMQDVLLIYMLSRGSVFFEGDVS
ncbi:hypothetical protein OK016_19535 [Vibrio chagasii]|nr:hypothetical protein [Vibrio chagasii]